MSYSLQPRSGAQTSNFSIQRSLRFASADLSNLTRTPSLASNRRTFTFSTWVKRVTLGTDQALFAAGATSNRFLLMFDANGALRIDANGATRRVSNAFFRDVSQWYHIVCAIDTTNSTPALRQRLWVNNLELTSFSTSSDFAINTDTDVNSTAIHALGRNTEVADRYLNGYLSETYFIDGVALNPSTFGFFDGNSMWQPKRYTGFFGANGFYLNFSDNSNTTAATLGRDYSPNANNWTPNNFSVATGVNNDSLIDTPTNNYCIMNDNDRNLSSTVTQGGLLVTPATSSSTRSTFRMDSGKWYFETTIGPVGSNVFIMGVIDQIHPLTSVLGFNSTGFGIGYYGFNGRVARNNTNIDTFATSTLDDVIGVAVDLDNNKVWFRKNGTWFGSGWNPATNTGGHDISARGSNPLFAAGGCGTPAAGASWFNFGQRPFQSTIPSGFLELNSNNLSKSLTNIKTAFRSQIYSGNGTAAGDRQFISLNFTPSMTWVRGRNATNSTTVSDIFRNAAGLLLTDDTNGETNPATTGLEQTAGLNGFTIVRQTTNARNNSGTNYVSYNWLQSPQYGFDIIQYTGDGTLDRPIQHRLGKTPEFIIVKRFDGAQSWRVWHRGFSSASHFTSFGTTAESNTNSPWGTGLKNESIFTVSASANSANTNGFRYVAYVFASIPGYSDFGTYIGNGVADGAFANLNFRPSMVFAKDRGAASLWGVWDIARGGSFNPFNQTFALGATTVEDTINTVDFLSNGIKLRVAGAPLNTASGVFVYCAWSEAAFKYARAR